jgi:hypothetical protein
MSDRENLRTVVAWDKDSTLVSTMKRQHLVPKIKAGELTWEDYALACGEDEPIEGAVSLMKLLAPHHLQYVMTGADDSARDIVEAQFARLELPVDCLLMKPRSNAEFPPSANACMKARWIWDLRDQGKEVVLFVEDWPETAQMIRDLTDVPVLVLNPCYPPELAAAKVYRAGCT